MATNTIRGHKGILKVDKNGGTGAAALLNLTSYTLDMTQDTIEISTMGQKRAGAVGILPINSKGRSREYTKGMMTFTGSADFFIDSSNVPGSTATTEPLDIFADTTETADIELWPEGEDAGASTDTKYSGQVIVTGFSITANVDGLVTGSVTFQGHGDLTADYTA